MTHPCESCLRWPECNGVAWGSKDCPATEAEKKKTVKRVPEVPAYLDDHTLSGLLEDD